MRHIREFRKAIQYLTPALAGVFILLFHSGYWSRTQESELTKRIWLPSPSSDIVMSGHLRTFALINWFRFSQAINHEAVDPRLGTLLSAISNESPKFYRLYSGAAIFMSLFSPDKVTIQRLFEKGMREFPGDWNITFKAAYHAVHEMGDEQTGAILLAKASQQGAPMWAAASAANYLMKADKRSLAIRTLEQALESAPNRHGRDQVKKRLDELLSQSAP